MKELTPHIAIALCTYNGAAFLHEQLQSFVNQTHGNWSLWVSDDGSTDGTWDILLAFQRDYGNAHDIRLLRGPGEGSCRNFLSLLCHPDFPHGYVALADQDDVWLKGKLARAVQMMRKTPHGYVLYGAQSFHVAQNLQILGRSKQPQHPPSFANAMVQNVVSGHSMVLSPEALQLVRRIGCDHEIPFHDWWIYQLVSGVGGEVVLDTRPVLLYRQHDTNVMGARRGMAALTARINALRAQTYKHWIAANLDTLWRHRGILNPEARAKIEAFQNTRVSRGAERAAFLRALGLKRQAPLGTVGLYLAGALGWV
ncbi:glycosyltransferase family 2 protein [Roseovarius phycicola]|uniref:Glycosyltransferase family 2 protein n=1 Tax=Roseovarius phycicola TaxID=3080976 RepID=A0ABZ2HIA6_9RHOB